MAGHSKWTQIKHKKAVSDTKKAKLFSKISREISAAVKEKGSNISANPRLRAAAERARAMGMPKDNIDRAIEKSFGSLSQENYLDFHYELSYPGGVMILVDGLTDNKNRTVAEIKHLVVLNGAKFSEPGSLQWNFEKIGTLEISLEENLPHNKNEVENLIMDSSASNCHELDGLWVVETEYSARDGIKNFFESKGIKIRKSEWDYKAKNKVSLDEEELKRLENFLEVLSDQDDVQNVYTNIA